MTDAELARLFRKLGRELDSRQRAQLSRLRNAERQLYDALIGELESTVNVTNGFITSRLSDSGILKAINRAISKVRATTLSEVHASAIQDIKDSLIGNSLYYQGVYANEDKAGFGDAKKGITDAIFDRLGIRDGKLIRGGYLDQFFTQNTADDEIRQVVATAIAARIRITDLKDQLRVLVKGTQQSSGILEAKYTPLVMDTYHQTDRAISSGFGQALKFKWAVYEGGLIETSRDFCIERDGKVFTTIEAEQWRHDPKLPKTKKERESGIVVNYTPLANLSNSAGSTATSMGRWNCRHRVRWISEQMAKRLAPEKFN